MIHSDWPLLYGWYGWLPQFLRDMVREMGFGRFLSMRPFTIAAGIIEGLGERYYPEHSCFLLPIGQAGIGLRDVAYLTGLRVAGRPLTGRTFADYRRHWRQHFGRVEIPKEER